MKHIYDENDCLESLKFHLENKNSTIRLLTEENRKLIEEYSKDEEIRKMQRKLDDMKDEYYLGFPITKEEWVKIERWKDKHKNEHEIESHRIMLEMFGSCGGGGYTYEFYPCGLGISGTIKCSCGASYEFRKIE